MVCSISEEHPVLISPWITLLNDTDNTFVPIFIIKGAYFTIYIGKFRTVIEDNRIEFDKE